jgi:hypothetical protein
VDRVINALRGPRKEISEIAAMACCPAEPLS